MYLGIEIGGTKLQLGIGDGIREPLLDCRRFDVDRSRGAVGILEQIEPCAHELLRLHNVTAIGIGFGGPVDSSNGVVVTSHQVGGWEGFALARWCEQSFRLPAYIGNDCDCATLAETRFGAGSSAASQSGRQADSLFYVTVGTGIGGGCTLNGRLLGTNPNLGVRPAIAEIGHLRPGPQSDKAEMTVESISSGTGIANSVRARISGAVAGSIEEARQDIEFGIEPALDDIRTEDEYISDLLQRCNGDLSVLDGRIVGQAAADGNEIAQGAVDHAIEVLGWAIAQAITLIAPEVVVVGGGVPLMGEHDFFRPLRKSVSTYVFPVLRGSYRIVPAALGEEVVVCGAIALAADRFPAEQQDQR